MTRRGADAVAARSSRAMLLRVSDVSPEKQWDEFWSTRPVDIRATLGVEFVHADEDTVETSMRFKPEIGQATGVYSAGALIQLADLAATWHCMRRAGVFDDPHAPFPFSIQMNAHLVGNTTSPVVARAELVSQSKSMMVAETVVRAEPDGKRLLLLTSTHLLRSPGRSSA